MSDAAEISSWPEFVAYVEATHIEPTVSGPGRARFTLRHGDRVELVLAWVHPSATGKPWLGLAVTLGNHALFRKRAALVANHRLPLGGFALVRESMLLTQTLPLDRLPVRLIGETLTALATTVAMLADSARPQAAEDAPFSYVFTTRMDVIP